MAEEDAEQGQSEVKLSKKQRREAERESRWPKKRRWADAFLTTVEGVEGNDTVLFFLVLVAYAWVHNFQATTFAWPRCQSCNIPSVGLFYRNYLFLMRAESFCSIGAACSRNG
jgi:hypothetical protein